MREASPQWGAPKASAPRSLAPKGLWAPLQGARRPIGRTERERRPEQQAGRRTGGAGRTEPHTQEAATARPPELHAGTAGTAGRPGKSGRSRGGGIVAAKEAPNRREPCRAGGRWGGQNRSRRRTRPRRPGRPFLRGMPRTRAAGPGAGGAARVGPNVSTANRSSGHLPQQLQFLFCKKRRNKELPPNWQPPYKKFSNERTSAERDEGTENDEDDQTNGQDSRRNKRRRLTEYR